MHTATFSTLSPTRPRTRLPAMAGLLACMLSLGACGGGGGSPPGDPAQVQDDAQGPVVVDPGPSGGGSGGSGGGGATTSAAPQLGGCPMFPDKAIFNTRIDDPARFPAHPQNAGWIAAVPAGTRFHADWGRNDDPRQPADYYGIPYNLVDGTASTTSWPVVSFSSSDPRTGPMDGYPDESDCAAPRTGGGYDIRQNCTTLVPSARRFPFPVDSLVKVEGTPCADAQQCGGDHHVLVVEQGACRLWESWASYKIDGQWFAGGTAAWDLNSYAQRPDTWTSADAAGLPILPLLARADEASTGEVNHALRVTFVGGSGPGRVIGPTYAWPARHRTASSQGVVPMGALLRLKSSFVIPANWTTQAKALARAMQRYGLYVADNGSNLFVQGDPDSSWDAATVSQLQQLTIEQFEFVDLRAITQDSRFRSDSLQASW